MFDFSKRETAKDDEFSDRNETVNPVSGSPTHAHAGATRRASPGSASEGAIIGPSIHIEGDLHGEEDLVIEGEVKGAVHLRHHSLTIGGKGKVTANIYANVINVDGYMHGDLFGAERVSIRKTAQVQGNVTSPRVSLEEGAQFKGSIEMDADSEALQVAFGDRRPAVRGTSAPAAVQPVVQKSATAVPTMAAKTEGGSTATAARGGKPV
jgi:cytoskeletal protein CcmA (bactofilin family)